MTRSCFTSVKDASLLSLTTSRSGVVSADENGDDVTDDDRDDVIDDVEASDDSEASELDCKCWCSVGEGARSRCCEGACSAERLGSKSGTRGVSGGCTERKHTQSALI